MGHMPAFIADLALLLMVAGVTTLLCKRINQPVVIGYIVAGVLIGPVIDFLPSITDTSNITIWADIGVIFLMFSLGLEFSLHKLAKVGSTAITAAAIALIGMLSVGILIGGALGWSMMNRIFLGGMLAMSSTTIIIKTFDDMHLRGKKWTESVFAVLVIEDVVAVFMMIILSTISVSQNISGGELVMSIAKLLFYLALWLILGIFLLPTFLKKVKNLMNDETLLVVSLGICFGMVWLADALGFSTALGAFLAGSILAGTIHAERVEHLVKPCKDLFGAVFFVSVGIMINPAMLIEYIGPILLITVAVMVGRVLIITLGMLAAGQKLSDSLHSAMSLAQIGEFSFIIANLGVTLGVTGDFLYPIIVAVSVITTLTTPYFIKAADKGVALANKILPESLLNAIERYSESKSHAKADKEHLWRNYLKSYFSTFLIYGVLILGIIELGISLLLPWLGEIIAPNFARIVSIVAIVLFVAPFLPPMLYFRNRYFTSLWLEKFANRLPLMALLVLRTAATVILLVMPVLRLYNLPVIPVVLITLVLAYFISRSDWIMGQYLQIQARFMTNFNERHLHEMENAKAAPSHAWLDEQLSVQEFICDEESKALNISLYDLGWGKNMHVTVLKIIRGGRNINIPDGSAVLQAGDVFFVMADSRQLENFAKVAELRKWAKPAENSLCTLREFIAERQGENDQIFCMAVNLDKSLHNLIGKSIKDSGIKEMWNCMLVGLERDYYPIIYPNPNMLLKEKDLLWLLGGQSMASRLIKGNIIAAADEEIVAEA